MFTISVNRCIVLVWTLFLVEDITGLQISTKPPSVTDGDVSNITIECSLSQNETQHVNDLLFICIRHKRVNQDENSFKVVAIMTYANVTPMAGPVIEKRQPPVVISGSMRRGPKPSIKPNEPKLTLQWPRESWECGDYGDYQCEVSYLDSSHKVSDFRSVVRLARNSSEDACNSSGPRPNGNYMVIVLLLTIVKSVVCLFYI